MPNCLNDPNVRVGQEVKWSAPVLPDITLIETQPTQSIVTAEMCATLNPRWSSENRIEKQKKERWQKRK